jgi:hypothetical protein
MNLFSKGPKEKTSESDEPSLSEIAQKSFTQEIRPDTSDLQNALLTKSAPSKYWLQCSLTLLSVVHKYKFFAFVFR